MQAVKVGWVGQTFALARCSDSQGKRTRNRIPKEERKTLVETFIKKYQKLNEGNFPSLNLTHKEVGGSFYTVREIVREIIQENRVLGPGDSASKVLILQDCDDHSFVGPLSLDGVSNLSTINGWTVEGSQTEGQYGYNEHSIILEGVVDTVDKSSLSINSVFSVKESDETDLSPSGRSIFSQNSDVDPFGYRLNLSCVDKETSGVNETLRTENEPYVQVFGKDRVHSLKESTKVEEEYQVGVSLATTTNSSADSFLNPSNEVDVSAESSDELFSFSDGATGSSSVDFSNSTPPSSDSDEVLAVESEVCMNGIGSGKVLKSTTATVSDTTLIDATEIPSEVALNTFDTKSEEHSFFTHIRVVPADSYDSLHMDFKGEFLDSSEEIKLAAVTEKYTESISDNEGLTEVDQSQGVTSNIILDEGVASSMSGISDLSSLETFEGKVETIPADKAVTRKEIDMSENSEELLAPVDTLPKPVPNSSGVSKNMSVRSDRQSTIDASKPKKVPREDPLWDAFKKFFAAFVKFWTE